MTKNNLLHSSLNHKLALKLSISINLLLTFFLFIGFLFKGNNEVYSYHTWQPTIFDFIIRSIASVFVFYLLYEFCFWVFRQNWKRRKRHLTAFFGTLGMAMFISVIFSIIIIHFLQIEQENLYKILIFGNLLKDLGMSIIVYLSTLAISALTHSQQMLLENQRLVAENIRNRHEALKNQLNPHFLFNSLNTLDGLIGFDDEKAHDYLQNLSSMFRYTIQNKEITTLKNEIHFVESYAYLMKIRYGDNLNIQYAVDEKYNLYHIMPISLQLLMENAIKHNVINDRYPLTIHIETTEKDTIKVSNAIQPKINTETGEGIGLANLVERYHLFFGMDVLITQNGIFTVEIPLIRDTLHVTRDGRNCHVSRVTCSERVTN